MVMVAARASLGVFLRRVPWSGRRRPPWDDETPVRGELFGVERIEQHARSLAAAQRVTQRPMPVRPLERRLRDNAAALRTIYRADDAEPDGSQGMAPAAAWLQDNAHFVEEQIREIRRALPAGRRSRLPRLAGGPFAGYSRIFGVAWAFVAHTDSHFDPDTLRRFIAAYQQTQTLTIGELWALAISLRVVLIENLRRLADRMVVERRERIDADRLAGRLFASGGAWAALEEDIATRSSAPLSGFFAAQLAKRLRDRDPRTTPALDWLETRLAQQGTSTAEVVQQVQRKLGASNVTVRNIITSLRLIAALDWSELFEGMSLVDARLRATSRFAAMDLATRNLYRGAIEQLGCGSPLSEPEIAGRALEAARRAAAGSANPAEAERMGDPGYHLIAEGRPALEREIGFRPDVGLRLGRLHRALGVGGYLGTLLLLTLVLLAAASWALWRALPAGVVPGWLPLLALLGWVPASEVATALLNRAIAARVGATALPGLDLSAGIPPALRTLVVVPTLLTSEAELLRQIEQLEIHHLSGTGGDIAFALLSDGVDADREVLEGDAALLAAGAAAIERLNRRHAHGPGPGGQRFFLLHRRRVFNAGENVWMGWERKRGKLHELNRLLRGATDTSFMPVAQRAPQVPAGVRYVLTLDADTRLPRDAAMRLVGKMAHPLNRPLWSASCRRVVAGHAILQPRVTPALPAEGQDSLYLRVFPGMGGISAYEAPSADLYQDVFDEGSYYGKGIYAVDMFEAALAGRVPENTLLSHDLFEGIFARSGFASDVEVVEAAPARYDVAARRQQRWTRGDWQLLPWIFGARHGPAALPLLGRWKMADNLRRSLLAPAQLLVLAACWLLPGAAATTGVLMLLAAGALPAGLGFLGGIVPRPGVLLRSHLHACLADLKLAAARVVLAIAFLPDQAWCMVEAMGTTLVRLWGTRRHLLEWTTSAQSTDRPVLGPGGFYRSMANGTALGLAVAAGALAIAPANAFLVLPFALLWLAAPALAYLASRAPARRPGQVPTAGERRELRWIARRTWSYFETFVTPADHMLPPDNFQEDPKPVVAHRTSPTDIGLYLLSAVAARDFGWIGLVRCVERLEATFATLQRLPRMRGHFLNWYDTRELRVLAPAYVSSVDSGNLAGYLIVLANACEEWRGAVARQAVAQDSLGVRDCLALARAAAGMLPEAGGERGRCFLALLDEMETLAGSTLAPVAVAAPMEWLAGKAAAAARAFLPAAGDASVANLLSWIDAVQRTLVDQREDRRQLAAMPGPLMARLQVLAESARAMARAMDFAFLVDPRRKLLSIGFSVADNRLDPSCYDLLASEARLASLWAIAKGDVATRHWFRLGRAAVPVGAGSVLLSWSGSMFEYLMPALVMHAPGGSLLEQTARLALRQQVAHGDALGVPWGISESAYNARDLELTYQYAGFGVPALGLKRGLAANVVIAPYATGLAAMVDAPAAARNYARLAQLGTFGRYGHYEALDYTRSRLPEGADHVIVRSFMAHHQGMTIVGIANALCGDRMRRRFHREPMIRAAELLLEEHVPREVATVRPAAGPALHPDAEARAEATAVRRVPLAAGGAPVTHLLSNGRYAVMLTAAGAGYSHWRDIAVTRWRADATRDDWGTFVFVRDARQARAWPVGGAPWRAFPGTTPAHGMALFAEDHAEFQRHDGDLATTLDVVVSSESDGEVRCVSLANGGDAPCEVELTTYAELVLATAAADAAHPAFSKMFVQTEYLAEFGALIATRRPRDPAEPRVWAAHFAVVEGERVAEPRYETERARFLGRDRGVGDAAALAGGGGLSNTVGTVLDPVFALRERVRVPAGDTLRVAFWTLVAATRAALLDLVDQHHDRSAFGRARLLAWTQAQVQLRHLGMAPSEAADFQRLAAPLLYADRRFRAPPEAILRGAGPQSGLWGQSVSGDLPIVLLRIDDVADIAQVRQLLRAHEYWRMKRLDVDLIIVNEHAASYAQDLQAAIDTAIRRSQSWTRPGQDPPHGAVHALRCDLMDTRGRALLQSVARIVLVAARGPVAQQLAQLPPVPELLQRPWPAPAAARPPPARPVAPARAVPEALEYFNGTGGFGCGGREYVVVLDALRTTPAPWINVIANSGFGFQVSASGSACTWSENSREHRLTPWSNDAVEDASGEAIYVRDDETGELWSPTAQPVRDGGRYVARHGFGYSRFGHEAGGLALELLQFVPLAEPVKIARLTLRNRSGRPRRLTVAAYVEWVLGVTRSGTAPFVTTGIDAATGALLAHNPWSTSFPGRTAFVDLGGRQTAWTADRTEFLGRNGSAAAPAGLLRDVPFSGATGAGLDPCGAISCGVELGVGETVEVDVFLGAGATTAEALALARRCREMELDAAFAAVERHWEAVLGTLQVQTPDRAMDILLNGWLLYQTLACRIQARAAFYQASGAYGFRDQLQDGMALVLALPGETRRHLLRTAGRQFAAGDVQHWWLPHSGQGVRTRISDDCVWLAHAVAHYVATTGDATVLDERVSFVEGPTLLPGEHEAFFQADESGASASLYAHCALGLDRAFEHLGAHGLPLIGTGDWNDGMNRVGAAGRGESVWLGWLLLETVARFAPLGDLHDAARTARWRGQAARLRAAIERSAWDGAWYRRATFDDGSWLGASASAECRIDAIAQSWAVIAGAVPERAALAMASVERLLVRRGDRLALLFAPPFDRSAHDPGYIRGYPPGLRENGGQYTHAALWNVLALTRLGEGDRAGALFALLNPIHHARTPEDVERYRVEPYVVAADVYSVAPHVGRGGWTWYTGSAGWMYRAGVEGILGIRRTGDALRVDPCIPAAWPAFEATLQVAGTRCHIRVENPGHRNRGCRRATLDDAALDVSSGHVCITLDGAAHRLWMSL